MNNPDPLGWCIPCFYEATISGADNLPHVPASMLVGGTGMCPTCAMALVGTIIGQNVINEFASVQGRAKNIPRGKPE